MRRHLAWTAFVVCCSLLVARPLLAAPRVYVIAVGNNEAPEPKEGEERLSALAFADDDAAAFYEFAGSFAHQRTVLSVLDARSQRRFPRVARAASPPAWASGWRLSAGTWNGFAVTKREAIRRSSSSSSAATGAPPGNCSFWMAVSRGSGSTNVCWAPCR